MRSRTSPTRTSGEVSPLTHDNQRTSAFGPRFVVQMVRGSGGGVSAYVLDRAVAHKVVRSFDPFPGSSSARLVAKAERLADDLNRRQA